VKKNVCLVEGIFKWGLILITRCMIWWCFFGWRVDSQK
jgi:hypothetical protein